MFKFSSIYFFQPILILIVCISCEVGPSYRLPDNDSPVNWKTSQTQEPAVETVCNWWEIFHDEGLNVLIQDALLYNRDLHAAIERIVQSRAISGIASSDLYPHFSLNPSYSNQIYLTEAYASNIVSSGTKLASKGIPFFREHLMAYVLPINLNWEIDLWGKLKNIYKSTKYSTESEIEAFNDLMLIVTTDLANNYFQVRTLDKQIDLYVETIKTRKKALEINQSRYDAQLSDYEPVLQAALELSNVESDYIETLRQEPK